MADQEKPDPLRQEYLKRAAFAQGFNARRCSRRGDIPHGLPQLKGASADVRRAFVEGWKEGAS